MVNPLKTLDRLHKQFIFMPLVRCLPIVKKYKSVLGDQDATSLTVDILMRFEIPEFDQRYLASIRNLFPRHARPKTYDVESIRKELALEEKITEDIKSKTGLTLTL